jgi:hypothetical protein
LDGVEFLRVRKLPAPGTNSAQLDAPLVLTWTSEDDVAERAAD